MPQPPAYIRIKDFTENFGSETDHSALNAELDKAGNSINDIRTNLALLQADDGKLRPAVVTPDSISAELRADLVNRVVLDSQQLLADAQAAAQSAEVDANTATIKAAETVASANTAATKAGEATASATAAGNAATTAGTKRDEAVAAKDAAVGAKDTAVGAANTATTKRDEAAAAAETATVKRDEAVAARDTAATKRDEAVAARETAVAKSAEASASATAAANSALNASSKTAVKGLKGNVNAVTPLTKFDVSADEVVLRDANGNTVKRHNTGVLTADFNLAGPARDGRDQVAAFPANSWVNKYIVWNGVSLATILSLSPPSVGPTLPAGDTHWVYATTLRWNASSNIIPVFVRGSKVRYDITAGGVIRIVNGTAPLTPTAVSCANLAPPNTVTALIGFLLAVSMSAVGGLSLLYRPTGSATTGQAMSRSDIQVAGGSSGSLNTEDVALGTSQQIDLWLTAAPATGGMFIDVYGYSVANGDA